MKRAISACEVGQRGSDYGGAVLKAADTSIAGRTEQTANAASLVIVIDCKSPTLDWIFLFAHSAHPALGFEHPVVLLDADPI